MDKNQKLPTSEIKIEFKENEYTIKFPDSGQFIDIELFKSNLSNNNYRGLLGSTISAEWAKYLIDTVATFNILIPNLNKDLNTDSILNLSLPDSLLLVKEYKDKFLPWYNEWMNLIITTEKS